MQNTIYILMRNDDPGPLSNPEKERRVLEIFERYHVPQVLAVIPNNVDDPHIWDRGKFHPLEENPQIIEILKEYQQKGLVEIAQHGYTHQTTKFRPGLTNQATENDFYQGIDKKWAAYKPAHKDGYSEFNGLSVEEQEEKVVKGKQYLEKIFGLKIDTFIFPWNSYNKEVLKILKKYGFQFVPGNDNKYVCPVICEIGCCNWDWEVERFRNLIKQAETLNRPVLTQFAYHSWEISEEFMKKLDELLYELSALKNIVFITPNQILQLVPWAPTVIKLRSCVVALEREIGLCIDKKISTPKYYVHNYLYYILRIVKLSLAVILFKYLKLNRIKIFNAVLGNCLV